MKISGLAAAALACLGLAGCQSVQALSFAPPATAVSFNTGSSTVAAAIDKARTRQNEFVAGSDRIANAPQAFDIPTMFAGLTALGGTIFNGPPAIAKGGALAAAGLLGGRTYYSFSARQSALLLGASADSCIAAAGEGVAEVDHPPASWDLAIAWAETAVTQTPPDPVASKIMQVAPIVKSAPSRLNGAVFDVEILVRKKLSVPGPPDISTLVSTYQSAMPKLQADAQSNANAAANAKPPPGHAAVLPPGQQAADLLVSDVVLLNNLTSLDTTLTACRGLVG